MAQLKRESTIKNIDILDFFYPIGTIYETMDGNFNPNTYWGGTWERIKAKFIYGVDPDNSSYSESNITGGEENHTLTVNEIPSHNHSIYKWAQGSGSDYSGGKIMSAFANGAALGNNSNVNTTNKGGGHLTTICHLTSLLIFGRELLNKIYNRVLSL